MSLKRPLFVALDVDTKEQALRIADQTAEWVGGFKIGPRLCMRYGPRLVEELAKNAPVFVDNKYFDIPSTMEAAIRATFEAGASFATVHAQSGSEALRRLAEVEAELNQQRSFRILSVTVLTSFRPETLPPHTRSLPVAEQVSGLAAFSHGCGLKGLVCSAVEVSTLRQKFNDAFLVVPGIRRPQDAKGDQARVSDPKTALENGASALVVGRPIVTAANPAKAAQEYFDEIKDFVRP